MNPSRPHVRPDAFLRTLHTSSVRPMRRIPHPKCLNQTRQFILRPRTNTRAVEGLNVNNMRQKAFEVHMRRRNFLLLGALSGLFSTGYVAYLLYGEITKPKQMDSKLPDGVSADPFSTEAGTRRKTVVHDADGKEIVPTGYSGVPTFPRTMDLEVGSTGHGTEAFTNAVEYTLVGLGMRSVSFLGIYVYLVGYYIATSDIAAIQSKLVKEINPIATTLVPSEKDELRRRLLDPVEGERLWLDIMKDVKPRTVFRIVPVKNTGFHHLRDGFVRAIQARSQSNADYADDSFGAAVKEFRDLFNRGKVPTGKELLLVRDGNGVLTVMYDESTGKGPKALGTVGRVTDERISRALWLNYLAGKTVASGAARKAIVDGIMEFVERPVGTVATQVL